MRPMVGRAARSEAALVAGAHRLRSMGIYPARQCVVACGESGMLGDCDEATSHVTISLLAWSEGSALTAQRLARVWVRAGGEGALRAVARRGSGRRPNYRRARGVHNLGV